MELTTLALSICLLYFILVFYHLQFNDNVYLSKPDKINPKDYESIEDDRNATYNDCYAIYPTAVPKCLPCGGNDYHLITIDDDQQSHVVDGIVLKPGMYCMRSNLPKCNSNLGVLVINGLNDFRCVCKFPHFYSGPSCATKVACGGDEHIPIVDKDGKEIGIDDNVDYYQALAHCKCPQYDPYGFVYLNEKYYKTPQCILDPCLYPLPKADAAYGLNGEGKCVCPTVTPNKGSEYSPCSACQNLPKMVPVGHEYPVKIAVDCYNEFSVISDLVTKYPCATLRSPIYCGTAEIDVGAGIEP